MEQIQRREQIENEWRARLETAASAWTTAREEYNRALADYHKALADLGEGPSLESRGGLEEAGSREQTTRAEYWRILRIFIDLVVHRKMPDAEAG
jgi:hypothetical protein